jgi:hypothetical protein
MMKLFTLVLAVSALLGCEPQDRRPGVWLSGEVAATPADWAFVNDHDEILVETQTWYGIPHSVTVVGATSPAGNVFVPSIYSAPMPFPGSKRWNKNIASDPNVRLKIGSRLYEMAARPAADDAEFDEGFRALAEQYDFWQTAYEDESKRPPFVIIRMEPRGAD